MRPGILPEHGFKHKGNRYATSPWFGAKIAHKYTKRDQSIQVFVASWNATFSRSLLQGNVRATSGHMRSDVSNEMSRFRLPSSGRRRLLLKGETLRFEGNEIHCSPRDQSLSYNCCTSYKYSLFLKSTNCTFFRLPPLLKVLLKLFCAWHLRILVTSQWGANEGCFETFTDSSELGLSIVLIFL